MFSFLNFRKKDALDQILDKIQRLYIKHQRSSNESKFQKLEEWQEIKELPEDQKFQLGLKAFHRLYCQEDNNDNPVFAQICRKHLFQILEHAEANKFHAFFLQLEKIHSLFRAPLKRIYQILKIYSNSHNRDQEFGRAIQSIKDKYRQITIPLKKEDAQCIELIFHLENDQENVLFYYNKDLLGQFLSSEIKSWNDFSKQIFAHCWSSPYASRPSKNWLQKSKSMAAGIDEVTIKIIDRLFLFYIHCSKEFIKDYKEANQTAQLPSANRFNRIEYNHANFGTIPDVYAQYLNNIDRYYINETNISGLSYLIWFAAILKNEQLDKRIHDAGEIAFTKLKGIGLLSNKIGNACLVAFALSPSKENALQLYKFKTKNKSKNKNILNFAENNIQRISNDLHVDGSNLVETYLQDWKTPGGMLEGTMGDYKYTIYLNDLKKIHWTDLRKNKPLRTVPKSILSDHWPEFDSLKKTVLDLNIALTALGKNLEDTFITGQSWEMPTWKRQYETHSAMAYFSRTIIWLLDEKVTIIRKGDQWVDANSSAINIEQFEKVCVWHPIYTPAEVTEAWRDYIFDNEIRQPFKQAFREIYLVTDAERESKYYSNRFAAHIIRQHQVRSLFKLRDWTSSFQGQWDGYDAPEKKFKSSGISCTFWIKPILESANENGVFSYLMTDKVYFEDENEQIPLEQVPLMIFSEAMRDIDLFVGVSSIGNDPNWEDQGDTYEYWSNYALGPLTPRSTGRKAVLERILPKLQIGNQCSISGNYLIVNGKLKSYKIHIGSSSILMSPNNKYLCIVNNYTTKRNDIFLPFDDDSMLSIVLSKAFLLANDHLIKDSSILNQIKQR